MIVTDKFVFINFPKTGTTFVRQALTKLYRDLAAGRIRTIGYKTGILKKPVCSILELPNIRAMGVRRGALDEHGTCVQVPDQYRNLDLISIKRDIWSRLISGYHYKDWQVNLAKDDLAVKKAFPAFPDLSFSEYIQLIYHHNPYEKIPEINGVIHVGPLSAAFIMYYFKDPFTILREIDAAYIESGRYKNDIYDVTFIDQRHLNQELYDLLLGYGFAEKRLRFILNGSKVNVSTPIGARIDDYFTPELRALVMDREALLLKIFGDYFV